MWVYTVLPICCFGWGYTWRYVRIMSDTLGFRERVMLGVKNGAEARKQVFLYKIAFSPDASWPSAHSTTENKCCLTAVSGTWCTGVPWHCVRQVPSYVTLVLTVVDPAGLGSSTEEHNRGQRKHW